MLYEEYTSIEWFQLLVMVTFYAASSCPKNKLSFVDGSIQAPNLLDLNIVAWERCSYLVHSWILNSVIEPIAQTIVFPENALNA